MRKIRIHISYFRIFYSVSYTVLGLCLLGLLVVTPFDHIYQTVSNDKLGNLFVVAGVYLVTAFIAAFIYFSRIFTNRTTLAAIPRTYLPIERNELSRSVYKMVVKNRQRSALIAWDSRPRDVAVEAACHKHVRHSIETSDTFAEETEKVDPKKKAVQKLDASTIIPIDPASPPWGLVYHPGWSSSGTADIPSLHFETVIAELPNLVEAKAVSLAPPDPAFNFLNSNSNYDEIQAPPDPGIVSLLQRKPNMGLREYLGHLHSLGMIDESYASGELERQFLTQYEYARYSVEALTENEFRALMTKFSHVLSSIVPLDPENLQDEEDGLVQKRKSLRYSEAASRDDAASLASSTGSIVHHAG